jgi:5'-nucleotidase (lipoprotein e(P4) family)
MKKLFYFLFPLLLTTCTYVYAQGDKYLRTSVPIPSGITHNSTSRSITSLEYSLNAVLWQQHSGEYKALCYQTFALAKMRLMEKIAAHKKGEAPIAIVTDIDETILDNSPQQAADILNGTTYTESSWKAWTSKATAEALPGAVAFFQWADKMGVQCFYISNRRPEEKDASIKNLAEAGFPQADSQHVQMKEGTSDKEPRRRRIREKYKIVMLLGDNLNDFDSMFYDQSSTERSGLVHNHSNLFGDDFIILPNAIYGDWESAIWKGKTVTAVEADSIKHNALKTF